MKTSRHLDWLSITLLGGSDWRAFLPHTNYRLAGKGRHGYREMWRDDIIGTEIQTFADDKRMGHHITLSGDALWGLRDNFGLSDDDLIKRMTTEWSKCSRVDLAIDIFDASLSPADLNDALNSGTAAIPARTWRFIDGHKNGINGATVDTGDTSSDRRFRFYDKRAEMRIKDGDAWVRLELQLRRLYAKSMIASCGLHSVAGMVGSAIGSYLTWGNTEYRAATTGASVDGLTIPRKASNRKKWLLGQVAKALADECRIDPYFRERFNRAVNGFFYPDK